MSEKEDKNIINPDDVDPDGKQGGGDGGDEKKFTQADIDAAVKDRIKREKEKYADYDDLKAKATKLDEIEENNKTELEKAKEEADKAKREGQDALNKANQRILQAEFAVEASKLNCKKPGRCFPARR